MSGPWEKYQQAAPNAPAGPWAKYRSASAPPAPATTAPATPSAHNGPLGQLNAGLMELVNAPGQLVTSLADAMGFGEAVRSVPGPSFNEMLRSVGVAVADEPAEGLGENVMRGVGQSAGALVPFGAAARGMGALAPTVMKTGSAVVPSIEGGTTTIPVSLPSMTQGVAKAMAAPFGGSGRVNPLPWWVPTLHPAIVAETTAGAGAGAGRYVADEMSGGEAGPLAQFAGETIGGVIGGMGPAAVARGVGAVTKRMPVLDRGLRAAKATIFPGTDMGDRARAAERLRSLTPDPKAAAAMLDEPSAGDLLPAQQTGDARLMALEKAAADSDPVFAERRAGRIAASNRLLQEQALEPTAGATAADTRAFLEQTREQSRRETQRLVEQVQRETDVNISAAERSAAERISTERARADAYLNSSQTLANRMTSDVAATAEAAIARAQQRARERTAALTPRQRETQASLILREELDNAYAQANARVRQLWNEVPLEVEAPTAATNATVKAIRANLGRAQAGDVPAEIGVLEELGQVTSARELQSLRSALLETARRARADGRENTARIADRVADAILDDLDSAADVSEPLAAARDATRDLHDRFTRGTVGRVLGTLRNGGDRVAPERTGEALLGGRGARGVVTTDELRAATGANANVDAASADLIRDRFTRAAVRDGQVDPRLADTFVRDNAEMLERFPTIRREIDDAIAEVNRARTTTVEQQARQRDVAAREAQRIADIKKAEKARLATVEERARERADGVKRAETARRTQTEQDANTALRAMDQTPSAAFVKQQHGEEIKALHIAKNPRQAAKDIVESLKGDSTGTALSGLRTAVIEDLFDKARTQVITEDGDRIVSGATLQALLKHHRYGPVAEEVLDPQELQRFKRIASELRSVAAATGAGGRELPDVGGVINDPVNSVVSLIGRYIAANHGGKLGSTSGSSLQMANFASRRMQRLLEQLTNSGAEKILRQAVEDRELFRELLLGVNTKQFQRHQNRLIETLIAITGQQTPDEPLRVEMGPPRIEDDAE